MRNSNIFSPDIQKHIKNHYLKTVGSFLGWFIGFGLILWFFGDKLFGNLQQWQTILIYSLMMISTVWISKLPGRLRNRTFYGTVEQVCVKTTYVDINWQGHLEPPPENHVVLLIVTPEGKKITKKVYSVALKTPNKQTKDQLPKINMDIYEKGDVVVHLAGTSHTVVLPKPCDDHVKCAVCGHANAITQTVCKDCDHTLIKNLM